MAQTLSLVEIYNMLNESIVMEILIGLGVLLQTSHVDFIWPDEPDASNTDMSDRPDSKPNTTDPISCIVHYDDLTSYDILHADDGDLCINYMCRILCAIKNIRQGLPADSGFGCAPDNEMRFLRHDIYLYHMLQMDHVKQIENRLDKMVPVDGPANPVEYVMIGNDRKVGYKWDIIKEFPEFEGL